MARSFGGETPNTAEPPLFRGSVASSSCCAAHQMPAKARAPIGENRSRSYHLNVHVTRPKKQGVICIFVISGGDARQRMGSLYISPAAGHVHSGRGKQRQLDNLARCGRARATPRGEASVAQGQRRQIQRECHAGGRSLTGEDGFP